MDVPESNTSQEAEKNKKRSFETIEGLEAGGIVQPDGSETIRLNSDENSEEVKEKKRKKKEHAEAIEAEQHSTEKNVKPPTAILSDQNTGAGEGAQISEDQVVEVDAADGEGAPNPVDQVVNVDAADGNNELAPVEFIDHVVDVDAADGDNELAVVEYLDEIYNFYQRSESKGCVHNYMPLQPVVNADMRAELLDCLIEIHTVLELMPESLYLTINIVDRYLSLIAVSKEDLRLIGISSMFIACKYEEVWPPKTSCFVRASSNSQFEYGKMKMKVSSLMQISDCAYKREQLLVMENKILRELKWYLNVPTPYVYLVRYIKVSSPFDVEMENMVYFLAELSLVYYDIVISYGPSMIAAAAVYAARFTLDRNPFWTQTLQHYTTFPEEQLRECAELMVTLHSLTGESELKAVYQKFLDPKRHSVALHPPGMGLLLL